LTWAVDGQQTIDLFRENPDKYHLILMDIKMPGVDGIEALKEIRKIKEKIPIIAVTAYANERERISLLKKNFSDYVSKPIHANVLLQVIERFLGKQMT
jgi:CheY-like chemotaxis protein